MSDASGLVWSSNHTHGNKIWFIFQPLQKAKINFDKMFFVIF
jgi:hypothetical protein